jgi:hypothetical protein
MVLQNDVPSPCARDPNGKDVKLYATFPTDVTLHIVVVVGCCVNVHITPIPCFLEQVDALSFVVGSSMQDIINCNPSIPCYLEDDA